MGKLLICMVGSIRPGWPAALESLRSIVDTFDTTDIQIVTNNRAELYPPWVLTPGVCVKPVDYRFDRTFSPDIREKCKQINTFIVDNNIAVPNCMRKSIDVLIDRVYIEDILKKSQLNLKKIQIKLIDNYKESNMISMVDKFSLIDVSNDYDWVLRIRPDYMYTIPTFQIESYNDERGICVNRLRKFGDVFNKDLPANWTCDGTALGTPDKMKVYFQLASHINNPKKISLNQIHYFLFDYLYSNNIELYTCDNFKTRVTKFYIDQHYIDNLLPLFLGKSYNLIKDANNLL